MAIKSSPDPRNNMWDFIAYYLRVWRKRMDGHGPRITEILQISDATLSRLEHSQRRLSGDEAVKVDKAWGTGGLFFSSGLVCIYRSRPAVVCPVPTPRTSGRCDQHVRGSGDPRPSSD